MDRQTIAAGWLTLRPFTPADIPWVYEVSLDPVLQRFMQVPSPYRLEDAASHVLQAHIAGWDDGRRAGAAKRATSLLAESRRRPDSSSRRRCAGGVSVMACGWTSGSVRCSATR
jgi:hypothetical protein